MTFAEILEHQRHHWRKPWVWAITMAMTISQFLTDVLAVRSGNPVPYWWLGCYFLWIAATNATGVALGPWAWLWTGRRESYPKLWRSLVQVILFCILGFGLSILMELGLRSLRGPLPPLAQLWRGTYPAFFGYISVFGLVGFGIVAYGKETFARNEAEKRAQEAQWILLKGQMNPHVFFNAMNNLTQLIQADPPLAERAAMDLSDLFRRLMSHGQSHLTPLREERLLVERYLGIEALRLGSRLNVTWDWEGPLDEVLAPPFLIQPLVENAIKHGLAPHPPGGELRLSGQITQGQVCIRVENTGLPLRPRQSGGSGLDNLEARLRLAFEEEGGFSLESMDTFTRAELRFPVLQEAR